MPGPQPSGLVSENGYIVTIGVVGNADRTAIVFPLATNGTVDPITGAQDLITGIETTILDEITPCFSEDGQITFVSAESMVDGHLPARSDYDDNTYPGTRASGAVSSQVASLLIFYSDPADLPPDGRVRVGKNFIPFVPEDDLSGDIISDPLSSNIEALGYDLLNGFSAGSNTFYRVIAADSTRTPGTPLIRSAQRTARGYVGTQRRRLIPH